MLLRDLKARVLLLVLVPLIACSPTGGCIEANFTLAPESPIPIWFTLPAGMSRNDVTVSMDSWLGPLGRTATFTLLDKTGERLDRVTGDKAGHEPINLSISEYPSNPSFEFVTVGGVAEVIEHRRMGPIFHINRDPKVRAQVEKIAKGQTVDDSVVERCDGPNALKAEEVAGAATTWRELHGTFALFKACDDGAIAEGFTESATVILTDRWSSLSELASIASQDPPFLEFVLLHVNGSADVNRLKQIADLSGSACPAKLLDLCRRVEKQALNAIQELK